MLNFWTDTMTRMIIMQSLVKYVASMAKGMKCTMWMMKGISGLRT